MKNILRLLALLTVSAPIAPISLNVATHTSKNTQSVAKLTELGKQNSNFYALSETTGILQENLTNRAYFFDATKINESSKGFTDLEKNFDFLSFIVPGFYNLSETTGIFIEGDTNKTYFFDATKMNESSKGFVDLNQEIKTFNRLSKTTGILMTILNQVYLFDSTKLSESSKGLTDLGNLFSNFYRLTDTTGIFAFKYSEAYFFDATKVSASSNGLIKIADKNQMTKFYRLSDTTGIFQQTINGQVYFFDATKINESSKGLIDLEINMNTAELSIDNFLAISDTTAIIKADLQSGSWNDHDHMYFFDATKINESSKGVSYLNKRVIDLIPVNRLSNTIIIIREKETNKAYLFDSTKVNEDSYGFIDLNQKIQFCKTLSNTTALLLDGKNEGFFFDATKVNESTKGLVDLNKKFDETVFVFNSPLSETSIILTELNTNQFYLFDATKINEPSKRMIDLKQKSEILKKTFTRLTDTTGILTNSDSESYYFEYK